VNKSDEVISLLRHSLKSRGYLELPASGTSMFPYIRSGKVCTFLPYEGEVKRGATILYTSASGQLIAHRLHRTIRVGGELRFLCKGDSNIGYDNWIGMEQIIGVLSTVRDTRDGSRLQVGDLSERLWTFTMMYVPYSHYILNRLVNRMNMKRISGVSP
jgi:signal peptidase